MYLFLFSVYAQPTLSEHNIRDILYQSHFEQQVQYTDMLGEGAGHFDSDPRINWEEVNCTTWWQQVIAKGYSETQREELEILDRIRYFDGVVGFGTRKHFLDRALDIDPAPLINIDTQDYLLCLPDRQKSVELNLPLFTKNQNYACPLYKPDQIHSSFSYFSPNALLSCASRLPDGIYVLFPIAMDEYIAVWGQRSGPMGRVHGLILNQEGGSSQVYHASIKQKRVQTLPLLDYISSASAGLFEGYQLFMLSPEFPEAKEKTTTHQQALDCEQRILSDKR